MITEKIHLGEPIRKEKILIGGKTEIRDVYSVDIKELHYNDQNGRIATFISTYESLNRAISELSKKEYNDTIMKYIKESGSESKFKTTKDSIKEHGQLKLGIILEDGRVIDGNRRFTCLRELYSETSNEKYRKFECFVIPVPKTREEQITIKSLELNYQFGEDQREDYNPIDKLVDIYNVLVDEEKKMFTPEEYISRTNNMIKLKDLRLMMSKSKILHDYLIFIGKKGQYGFAREVKLDGPIQELAILKNKINDEESWDEISPNFYRRLEGINSGDKTREMRKFIKIYHDNREKFDEISDSQLDNAINYNNNINIKNNVDLDDEITKSYVKIQKENSRKKQIKTLEDARKKISDIDNIAIKYLNDDEKNEISEEINEIERLLSKIKKVISDNE